LWNRRLLLPAFPASVKPVLAGPDVTTDGVTYSTRYVLCGVGSCSLSSVEVIGKGPKHTEIFCTGKCATDCKCTLFRLGTGGAGFDPTKAKWELLAKTDTQVTPSEDYIYRCFCVK
jgi:hypothetical protein